MFDCEIRPQLARQRQHERTAHQQARAIGSDEQQRQALMPVPAAEEAQGPVRGTTRAEGAAEAEDGDALCSLIAREMQQSVPTLRKQTDAVARCSAHYCGSGRDDQSSA